MWYGQSEFHGEFSRQGKHQYLQQLQFFADWFWDILPLFSIWEHLENSPISQQALGSGHMLTVDFLLT
jgi:hypothetical protein